MNKSISINEELKNWYMKMEINEDNLGNDDLQDFDVYVEWISNNKNSDQYALAFEIKILK